MTHNQIFIKNDIFNWIKDSVKLSNEELNILENWQKGIANPKIKDLEKFSKATHIPLGYFFLDRPMQGKAKLLKYRTINSVEMQKASRDLIDTINQMENIQNWMKEYLANQNPNYKVELVGHLDKKQSVLELAKSVREVLDIQEEWYTQRDVSDGFNFLRRVIGNAGILVFKNGIVANNTRRKLDIDEFRAFAMIDSVAPLIFLNSNDTVNGNNFSLIHEFVHIGFGEYSLYNVDFKRDRDYVVSALEKICNAVTAEILVPQVHFERMWHSSIGLSENERIKTLSNHFKCSSVVITRRAYDSNLISCQAYKDIVEQATLSFASLKKDKKKDGGDFYKTAQSRIDHRFLLALSSSVVSGNTQYTQAFRLTGTKRLTFKKLVEEVRGDNIGK